MIYALRYRNILSSQVPIAKESRKNLSQKLKKGKPKTLINLHSWFYPHICASHAHAICAKAKRNVREVNIQTPTLIRTHACAHKSLLITCVECRKQCFIHYIHCLRKSTFQKQLDKYAVVASSSTFSSI